MSDLTQKKLRGLFTAIEINLLLWLTVCGTLWSSATVEDRVKHYATAGMIIAAVLQHWAYYNLYRKTKTKE